MAIKDKQELNMACIENINKSNGKERWQVTLSVRSVRFRLTFDNRSDACTWAEENELKYAEDPQSYFKWKKELGYTMCRSDNRSLKGIVKPRMKKV